MVGSAVARNTRCGSSAWSEKVPPKWFVVLSAGRKTALEIAANHGDADRLADRDQSRLVGRGQEHERKL